MAFTNQQTSSVADLFTKLYTFATSNGWTGDHNDYSNGKVAFSKSPGSNKLFVSFRWDTSTVQYIGIYQALGFSGTGTDPGNHTDDSGNGKVSGTNATLATGRHIYIPQSATVPIQFWAFEDDHYIHVVVETTADTYVHFGIGLGDKKGDWTGGEYCYGHKQILASSLVAVKKGTSILLDGLSDNSDTPTDMEDYVATVHAEGLPNEGGSSKWAINAGNIGSGSLGTDRGSNARIHFSGGFRAGPIARPFGRFSANSSSGIVPGYPLGLFYWNRTNGYKYGPMMFIKDVRGVNIQYFTGGDEITVGSDTWVLFPAYKKAVGSLTNTSAYQGIMYKKVTS